jgi:hypothetical protein
MSQISLCFSIGLRDDVQGSDDYFVTMTADVFTDVYAKAQFIDSPYAFPHCNTYKSNSKYNVHKYRTALRKYEYILVMWVQIQLLVFQHWNERRIKAKLSFAS